MAAACRHRSQQGSPKPGRVQSSKVACLGPDCTETCLLAAESVRPVAPHLLSQGIPLATVLYQYLSCIIPESLCDTQGFMKSIAQIQQCLSAPTPGSSTGKVPKACCSNLQHRYSWPCEGKVSFPGFGTRHGCTTQIS